MFDDFKDSQDIAYSILKNAIMNGKLSHAYLIDANGCSDATRFVMSFVKAIICENNYTNFDCCKGCNKCARIDSNNFLEVKIIEPDGLTIKKEQLLELQDEFSLSSIESSRRVYIIKDCDKMTTQASNSLLKFLEEPNGDIIALLLTDNFNKMLSTIVSRCQVIKLKKNNFCLMDNALSNFALLYGNNDIDAFLEDERNNDILKAVMDFVSYYESNGIDVMIYLKKMWHNYFKDRSDNIMALNLLINIYYDILKYKCNMNNLFYKDYINYIVELADNNSMEEVIHKIDVCIDTKEMLKCNLNINLLIDNMVIELGGDSNECCTG